MKIFYMFGCIVSAIGCVAVVSASKESVANHDTGQRILLAAFMILFVLVAVYCLHQIFTRSK